MQQELSLLLSLFIIYNICIAHYLIKITLRANRKKNCTEPNVILWCELRSLSDHDDLTWAQVNCIPDIKFYTIQAQCSSTYHFCKFFLIFKEKKLSMYICAWLHLC